MSQAKRPRTEAASTPAWRNFVPQPTLHVTCVYCLPSVCAALCSPRSIRGEIGGKAAAPVSHAEDGDTQMASACDVLSARAMLRGGAQPIQLVTSTGRSVSLGALRADTRTKTAACARAVRVPRCNRICQATTMRRTAGIKNNIGTRVERREKPSDLRIPYSYRLQPSRCKVHP